MSGDGHTELVNLKVAKISLVRHPANDRPLLVCKSAEGTMAGETKTIEVQGPLAGVVEFIANAELGKEDVAKAAAIVKGMKPENVAKVAQAVKLLKGTDETMSPDQWGQVCEACGQKAPAAKAAETTPEDPILKAIPVVNGQPDFSQFPEAVRKGVEALYAAHQAAKAEAQAAAAKLAAEEVRKSADAKTAREVEITKSVEAHKSLVGNRADLVAVCKALDGKPELPKLMAVLKALDATLAKSALFVELGTALGGESNGPDPYAALQAMAAAQVTKAAGTLTPAQAFAEVCKSKEGAALYEAYSAAHTKRAVGSGAAA